MEMTQTLAAPQEFDESNPEAALPQVNRVNVSPAAPKRTVMVPRGKDRPPVAVQVIDKNAMFCVPVQTLAARLHSVVTRPISERVMVYDPEGLLLARFESMEQARQKFAEAGVQKRVDDWFAFQAKEQAKARHKSDQLARALQKHTEPGTSAAVEQQREIDTLRQELAELRALLAGKKGKQKEKEN